MKKIEDYIRSVPDFPKKGIMFRDITSALQDKEGLKLTIDSLERTIFLLAIRYLKSSYSLNVSSTFSPETVTVCLS